MRLLPEVLSERSDGARFEIDLRVPVDLACLSGHFPGMPILPGVVQVDWSVRLAQPRLAPQGEFSRAENLKFLSIVWPQAELTLALELASETRLDFRYFSGSRKYSSGTLVFEAA
jgi:3-hydroxymyristoyl/3-hydroxydecanoyl-(acyl carrier protein) dehydratase